MLNTGGRARCPQLVFVAALTPPVLLTKAVSCRRIVSSQDFHHVGRIQDTPSSSNLLVLPAPPARQAEQLVWMYVDFLARYDTTSFPHRYRKCGVLPCRCGLVEPEPESAQNEYSLTGVTTQRYLHDITISRYHPPDSIFSSITGLNGDAALAFAESESRITCPVCDHGRGWAWHGMAWHLPNPKTNYELIQTPVLPAACCCAASRGFLPLLGGNDQPKPNLSLPLLSSPRHFPPSPPLPSPLRLPNRYRLGREGRSSMWNQNASSSRGVS